MSDEHTPSDPRLAAWLAAVAYYWKRLGVADDDRIRLRRDLERDLQDALAQGASVEDVTAVEPSEFARELAGADGIAARPLHRDPPLTTESFVVTALLGALTGALASLVLVYLPGLHILDALALSYTGQGVFVVGLHVLAACVSAASAMAAVHWRFRFHNHIRRTTVLTGASLLLGGAASVAPTVAYAASLGFSGDAPVVTTEVGLVLAFCIAGLLTAHRILTHTSRRPHTGTTA